MSEFWFASRFFLLELNSYGHGGITLDRLFETVILLQTIITHYQMIACLSEVPATFVLIGQLLCLLLSPLTQLAIANLQMTGVLLTLTASRNIRRRHLRRTAEVQPVLIKLHYRTENLLLLVKCFGF